MRSQIRHRSGECLGYDEQGRPIFGYGKHGRPVCFSLKRVTHQRCMSEVRCPNGRCKNHGGVHPEGPAHSQYRTGLYAHSLGHSALGRKFRAAAEDTNYLHLQNEMAINAVEIATIMQNISGGFDEKQWVEAVKIAEGMEKIIFGEDFCNLVETFTKKDDETRQLKRWSERFSILMHTGANQAKIFKQAGEAIERRRRLVESEIKRETIAKNSMTTEEVMTLFNHIIQCAIRVFASYPNELRIFAGEVDKVSSEQSARKALGGVGGAAGIVQPRSSLTRKMSPEWREEIENEVIEQTIHSGKVFNRKIAT